MGKRIIQRRRGTGSPTYRVRDYACSIRFTYPAIEGKGTILKLFNSVGYTAPIAMLKVGHETFFNVAVDKISQGQEIQMGSNAEIKAGNIMPLKSLPVGAEICNIESNYLSNGKMIRTGGSFATITKKIPKKVAVLLPSKKEVLIDEDARATVGRVAGSGRVDKPFVKAGAKHYLKKSKSKHYPRTSPIKRNAVNHPFGGGRGKNMGKPGIAPRWAPPGRKVGLIKPRKTGRGS